MIYLAVLLILTGVLIVLIVLFSNIQKSTVQYPLESEEETSSVYCNQSENKQSENSVHGENSSSQGDDVMFPSYGSERVESDQYYGTFAYDSEDTLPAAGSEEDIFLSFEDDSDFNEVNRTDELQDWNGVSDSVPEENLSIDYSRPGLDDGDEVPAYYSQPLKRDEYDAVLFDDASNIINYDNGEAVIDSSASAYNRIKRVGDGKVKVDGDGVTMDIGGRLYRFDFHRIYDVWSGKNFVALPMKNSKSVKLFLVKSGQNLPELMENSFSDFNKG